MSRTPLLIDCDPGNDDAVALLLSLRSEDVFEIVGVTTVAGNTDVHQARRNARAICDLADRKDIPVVAGCARPLILPHRDASDFHGASGMDGFPGRLPVLSRSDDHAVDFLIAVIRKAREPVTIVCLAPLTNLALALIKAPDLVPGIKEIVFMGGARAAGGNVTPCATFNLFCDPHAGHVVFESGCPLSVVSLDATAQVVASSDTLGRLRSLPGPVPGAAASLIEFFNRRRMEVYEYREDQTSINDPCVIAYLLDRSLFKGRVANVSIEHRSELTLGMSVVDFNGRAARPLNALWIDEVDANGVLELLVSTFGRR